MTLRVGLLIEGESSSAQAAAQQTDAALERLESQEQQTSTAAKANAVAHDAMGAAMRRASGDLSDLRAKFNPTYATIRQYKGAIDEIKAAHAAGALTSKEMAAAISAERREALASIGAIKARSSALEQQTHIANKMRMGYQQLGYQAGDFFTQLSMGGNAFVAFSVQAQQAVGAIQMMTAGGTAATGMMGRMATFMAGPWGIALGVVLPLIGMLAARLFETADASKAADKASEALSARQLDMANFFDLATGKIKEQNQALIQNAILKNRERLLEMQVDSRARGAQMRNLVEGSNRPNVTFGGTFGNETGRVRVNSTSRNNDLVDLFQQFGRDGNRADLARGLSRIASSNSTNAGRARQLSDMLAQTTLDAREINLRNAGIRSLETGTLDSQLWTPSNSRGNRGRRDRSAEVEARRVARLNQQAEDWAGRVEDRIARINDQWSEQPTRIQQANDATGQLQNIIEEAQQKLQQRGLGASEAAALRAQIESAQGAIENVKNGLNRPFNDMVQASARQRAEQTLILQGREQEAEVMRRIQQMQQAGVTIDADKRRIIEGIVQEEERLNDLLQQRDAIIGAYRQAISDVRGMLVDLLSGGSAGDFLKNLKQSFNRLRAELLTEKLFGPQLRQLERDLRNISVQTGLEPHVSALGTQVDTTATSMVRVETAANGLAQALDGAAAAARGDVGPAPAAATGAVEGEGSEIVVTARVEPDRTTVAGMSPNDYADRMGRILASPIVKLLRQIDDTLGTKVAGTIGGAIEGGISGYMRAGKVGAVLGAVQGSGLIKGKAGKTLGAAMDGAQQGYEIAQLGKMLGLKTSSTGGAIGGAIGSAIPIPGGQIIGSIAGSLLGGLFKKKPKGSTIITGVDDGDYTVSGNKAGVRDNLNTMSGSVQSIVSSIAEQLGGELGAFKVSIGQYKDSYRVSASGASNVGDKKFSKRAGSDLIYDGKDAEAAAMAAALNAIADGGVTGLSEKVQMALRSNKDLDKAVKEALKVQELEVALGGVQGAIKKEFDTFERQAKERLRIAKQYGFDVLAVEKYNAEQRLALTERLVDSQVGSLKSLLKEMTSGDLFEGTALDRRSALLLDIDKARADLDAGKEGAGDTLAQLYEQLNTLSKEIYGTTGGFAADRNMIIDQATAEIAKANQRVAESDPALAATNAALNENNDQNAEIIAALKDVNINLSGLLGSSGGGDSSRLWNMAAYQ